MNNEKIKEEYIDIGENVLITVAIIEDEAAAAKQLTDYLKNFEKEYGESFQIDHYENAGSFLEPYRQVEIVFMDIQMPGINGMEGAKMLREIDPETKLIFVTNMAQYAVQGYEVDALDFVVKPVSYKDFCFKLKRAVNAVKNSRHNFIEIRIPKGIERINATDLLYVEVEQHIVRYHLRDKCLEMRGTMKTVEEYLKQWHFLRCNSCYLINPRHIEWVRGYEIKLGDDILQISHPRKKKFMEELADYYS